MVCLCLSKAFSTPCLLAPVKGSFEEVGLGLAMLAVLSDLGSGPMTLVLALPLMPLLAGWPLEPFW